MTTLPDTTARIGDAVLIRHPDRLTLAAIRHWNDDGSVHLRAFVVDASGRLAVSDLPSCRQGAGVGEWLVAPWQRADPPAVEVAIEEMADVAPAAVVQPVVREPAVFPPAPQIAESIPVMLATQPAPSGTAAPRTPQRSRPTVVIIRR